MKTESKDLLIAGMFVIVIMLMIFIVVSLPRDGPVGGNTELDKLRSQISALEGRISTLEKSNNETAKFYTQCQKDLAECTPVTGECTAKDINYNTVCKKLGIGTMLRVDADRASDMVFQCVTDTRTVSIFFARTSGSTVQILDKSYNNVLNITDCRV